VHQAAIAFAAEEDLLQIGQEIGPYKILKEMAERSTVKI